MIKEVASPQDAPIKLSSAPDTHVVLAVFLMLAASFLFSVMAALVKLAAPTVPFMQMVFFRAAISVLILAPPMFLQKVSLIGQDLRVIALRGFSGFISVSFYFYALGQIMLGEVSALTQTSVIFVAFFSAAFLGERAKRVV
jgi:drug/metabolite transporter (DMT)-like permease